MTGLRLVEAQAHDVDLAAALLVLREPLFHGLDVVHPIDLAPAVVPVHDARLPPALDGVLKLVVCGSSTDTWGAGGGSARNAHRSSSFFIFFFVFLLSPPTPL